jgi:DMSO/TMAO reductase YedYZ molybdopterin-dependent catalytic subunit
MTTDHHAVIDRRGFLTRAGAVTASAFIAGPSLRTALADSAVPLTPGTPDGLSSVARLEALPGKKPLIKLSYRPPNYETPLEYFNEVLTPNDAFFVRYHLANIPEVSAAEWRLKIGGDAVERPAEYDLAALKNGFEQVELVAVCQCSGNRRGLSVPHVQGVEWGYGAMGNARWRGVRLKDVLAKSGVKKEALEVWLNGAETPIVDATPDFVKSIPVWKALDENTIIAFEMNGQPLPQLNGFPARLIVAGWTGTYWTKHLTNVDVNTKALSNFWMAAAYRVPTGKFPLVDHFVSQETATTTPITEMVVNSVMTNVRDGQRVKSGQPVTVKGIAWDAGYGIQDVEVSTDSGKSWRPAELGQDFGRYSFRPWSYRFTPPRPGTYAVMAKASNRIGATQTFVLNFNPAGYHNNVVQLVNLVAA